MAKSENKGMSSWQQGGVSKGKEYGQVTSSDQTVKDKTSIDSKFYTPRSGEFKVDVNPGTGMSK